MEEQRIIFADGLEQAVAEAVGACRADRLLVLTDETTHRLCWPLVGVLDCMRDARHIVVEPGDDHKDLQSLAHVWGEMQRHGATRHSLLVCLGGGMVTDLGGFAAATYKRGMHLVNIPTTLLAMVDASVGGKTGINFGGLKNEVGAFRSASAVVLHPGFLRTLDAANMLSGYAEMVKHALLCPRDASGHAGVLSRLLDFDIGSPDIAVLGQMAAESVEVKRRIVAEDPTERGLRKALNLGHTIGHAIESLALAKGRPVLHGYAVAWGLVGELYLSTAKSSFPVERMRQVARYICEHYGRPDITCRDYATLLQLMTHDKKNTADRINFTLLSDVGCVCIDQTATKEEIEEALDFCREGG